MLMLVIIATACQADPTPVAAGPGEFDSKVPSTEELKEEIEQAGDPEVEATQADAIDLIEHFHGAAEVEAYRQELLQQKAEQLSVELKAQETAEKTAKAQAVAKAKVEADELEAKVDEAAETK